VLSSFLRLLIALLICFVRDALWLQDQTRSGNMARMQAALLALFLFGIVAVASAAGEQEAAERLLQQLAMVTIASSALVHWLLLANRISLTKSLCYGDLRYLLSRTGSYRHCCLQNRNPESC